MEPNRYLIPYQEHGHEVKIVLTKQTFCDKVRQKIDISQRLETRIISMVEKATDKDELTSVIGTHGKFQLRVFLIVQFVGVFAAWQILVSIFLYV